MLKLAALLVYGTTIAQPDAEPRGARIGGAKIDAKLLPASSVTVTSEAELTAAIRRAMTRDLNVIIDRPIKVTGAIYMPRCDTIVRLIGIGQNAGIEFEISFDGNWRGPLARSTNGIELNCAQAFLRGLTFSGFNGGGAAIKGSVSQLLDISHCRFVDIATKRFEPRVAQPQEAQDTWYNHCVAAHDLPDAHISITDCVFERCAWNELWSHCLYLSARSVVVNDNLFTDCGSALRIAAGRVRGSSVTIFGNTIERPHEVANRQGKSRIEQPYLCDLNPEYFTAFVLNRVCGEYYRPWTGAPRPNRHLVDFNDYSQMAYREAFSWGADTGVGKWIAWEQWQGMGFDRNSVPAHVAPPSTKAP